MLQEILGMAIVAIALIGFGSFATYAILKEFYYFKKRH